MLEVKIGNNIFLQETLWRYMSLDKFINLIDSESLFFAPLSSYENSDPFEGYPPAIVLQLFAELRKAPLAEFEAAYQACAAYGQQNDPQGKNKRGQEQLFKIRSQLDAIEPKHRNDFIKIVKGATVNCWHRNQNESEAMWKLYSESGKGIAIKTSTGALLNAINSKVQDTQINIGAVRYIDFDSPDLQLRDCITDGILNPLLKRSSFNHENEVRLYTIADVTPESIDIFTPKPKIIGISIENLIEEIYISPFATEPFISSTIAVCKKYGIDTQKIKKSRLLSGLNELLSALTIPNGYQNPSE